MDLDTFLSLPTRRVDTTCESGIDPPAHCLDICQSVCLDGVVFPPGAYVFRADGHAAVAVRVAADAPHATWSTYRHLAAQIASLHHAEDSRNWSLFIHNKISSLSRVIPTMPYDGA